MEPTLIPFKVRQDPRGALVALEEAREIPFPIRRVYFVYAVPGQVRRGGHAHRTNRQVAVAVAGRCWFLLDNGRSRAEVALDSSDRGLLIDRMVWHEMYGFSPDCVLLMLASEPFDPEDYVRSYEEFLGARS